jgi:hypothetical protein
MPRVSVSNRPCGILFLEEPVKERLKRLARRLRRAAVECHYRGMRPASEWLDDFAIDVDRILVEVRLREQVELVSQQAREALQSQRAQKCAPETAEKKSPVCPMFPHLQAMDR